MHVSISKGNEKMGAIQSVSLPSGITCRDCECRKKCYAGRLEKLRRSVRNAYLNNLNVLNTEPETYWREVEAAIMLSRFFRFHVSGDIPSPDYFGQMVDIARRNPHCEILCFTKKYEIVNDYIADALHIRQARQLQTGQGESAPETDEIFPENLHIIMSAWRGLEMVNPYSLPEAHVRYRDGTTTASDGAIECGGNCTECAITEEGCWTLKRGEQVIFNEH